MIFDVNQIGRMASIGCIFSAMSYTQVLLLGLRGKEEITVLAANAISTVNIALVVTAFFKL